MDMIKNIPVHMDYVGQGRAEKLYQVLQIISDRQYFVTSHICVSDHHCSVWSSGPWLGLHHPAVLSDGEALDCLFNYVLIISLNSIQVYILGAGLVLASLLTIPPWGIYRLGRYHL